MTGPCAETNRISERQRHWLRSFWGTGNARSDQAAVSSRVATLIQCHVATAEAGIVQPYGRTSCETYLVRRCA